MEMTTIVVILGGLFLAIFILFPLTASVLFQHVVNVEKLSNADQILQGKRSAEAS